MGNILCCMERKPKKSSPQNHFLIDNNPSHPLFNPNETISAISPIASSPSQNDITNSLIHSNSNIEINFEKETEHNDNEFNFDDNNNNSHLSHEDFSVKNEESKEVPLHSYPPKIDIEINSFTLSYRCLHYFGMYFNPYICVYVNNKLLSEIAPLNDTSNNNSLSLSNISTLNYSGISMISRISNKSDIPDGNAENKEKIINIYSYELKKTIRNINKDDEHSLINIVIVNKIDNLIQNKSINVNNSKLNNVVIGRLCIDPMKNNKNNDILCGYNTIALYLNEENIGEVEMSVNYSKHYNIENDNNNIHYLHSLTLSEISTLTPSLDNESLLNIKLNDVNAIEKNLFSFISQYNQPSNDIILLYIIFSILTPYDINSYQFTSSFFNLLYNNKHSLSQVSKFISSLTFNLCFLYILSIFIYQYWFLFMKVNKENKITSLSSTLNDIIDFIFSISLMLYNYFCDNDKVILCNKERVILVNCICVINSILTFSRKITSKYADQILLSKDMRNKIIKTYELCINDSEILMMNTKLLRKSLLTNIDFNKNKNMNIPNESLLSIMNTTIKVCHIYQHYPQLYINILAIVFNLTYKIHDSKVHINLDVLIKSFNLYRGILKGEFKQINKFHLGILVNVLRYSKKHKEIIKDNNTISDEEIDLIVNDIKKFYNNDKITEDFLKRKQRHIDIHEKLLLLAVEVVERNPKMIKNFKEVYIDIVCFIFYIKEEYMNNLKGKEYEIFCIINNTMILLKKLCLDIDDEVLKAIKDIIYNKSKKDIDEFCEEIIAGELIEKIKKQTGKQYEKEINKILIESNELKNYFTYDEGKEKLEK